MHSVTRTDAKFDKLMQTRGAHQVQFHFGECCWQRSITTANVAKQAMCSDYVKMQSVNGLSDSHAEDSYAALGQQS